jgi:hypothetical protein
MRVNIRILSNREIIRDTYGRDSINNSRRVELDFGAGEQMLGCDE